MAMAAKENDLKRTNSSIESYGQEGVSDEDEFVEGVAQHIATSTLGGEDCRRDHALSLPHQRHAEGQK